AVAADSGGSGLRAPGAGGCAQPAPPSPDEARAGRGRPTNPIEWRRVRCDLASLLLPPSRARAATREGARRSFGLDEPRGPRRVPRVRAIVDDGPRRVREAPRRSITV